MERILTKYLARNYHVEYDPALVHLLGPVRMRSAAVLAATSVTHAPCCLRSLYTACPRRRGSPTASRS